MALKDNEMVSLCFLALEVNETFKLDCLCQHARGFSALLLNVIQTDRVSLKFGVGQTSILAIACWRVVLSAATSFLNSADSHPFLWLSHIVSLHLKHQFL